MPTGSGRRKLPAMHRAYPGLRRRRWWVAALLPALLLRALIPAGFMPAVGAGSLALVFCEPSALGAAGPGAHHHHHGQDPTGHGSHAASGECPFAQSAAPVLPTVPALDHGHPQLAHVAAIRRDDQVFRTVPPRHAAARGPPESC